MGGVSTFILHGIDRIHEAAKWLLKAMDTSGIVAFYGEMGAGKTSLIQAICKELGATEPVTSPTFSLVNEYVLAGDKIVYHFDFYRLENIEEAFDFGYEEYFYSGELCLVEWPEKIETLLPPGCLRIGIEVLPDQKRKIELKLHMNDT